MPAAYNNSNKGHSSECNHKAVHLRIILSSGLGSTQPSNHEHFNPFRLETGEDESIIFSFIGQVKDRLPYLIKEVHPYKSIENDIRQIENQVNSIKSNGKSGSLRSVMITIANKGGMNFEFFQ